MVRTELTPSLDGYYAQICRSVVARPARARVSSKSFDLFNEAVEAGLAGGASRGYRRGHRPGGETTCFRKHGYGEYTSSKYTRVRGHGHGPVPGRDPGPCSRTTRR